MFLLSVAMLRIGLVKPTEKTWGWWIAILVAAQPGLDLQSIRSASGEDGLHLVQQLKAAHDQNLVGLESGDLLIAEYPGTIDEFRAKHPAQYATAFSEDPPMVSSLDVFMLSRLKTLVPCRSSKGSVAKQHSALQAEPAQQVWQAEQAEQAKQTKQS